MGFGAMEIVGKYPAYWRASTHPDEREICAVFLGSLDTPGASVA
jgi:hypothetical protein